MTYSKIICSDEKIIEAIKNNDAMAKAAIECGIHFNTFKRRAEKLGVYDPNQGRKGVTRGHYCERRISTDEILEGKHPYYQCFKLKNRLLEEKILEYFCSVCNIDQYQGKFIALELDHINGNRRDHRLENLRLLCPNCHSQTPTFRSKKR
jgi:5-methylcytosine-specific restriction endonuclease McrA